ncbi:MAG: MATE family efflux transporter [Beduini sp.]|uniref:MATE family efflux transporter n=1 Tax=Beduini sp. TaxID=1922300 RepID=UPI00399F7AD4
MSNNRKLTNDLTEGHVGKKLLVFALPFMLSNALQMIYNMVDMVVVGKFVGSSGLSAVSISAQIVMLMTTLCMGFSTSGQVYISQLTGAGNKEGIKKAVGTLFSTLMIGAVIMSIIGIVGSNTFLHLLNTPSESIAQANIYMYICSGGIIFTFGYNMVSAVLRGMGDSKRPFMFVAIASVINLVLDLLFVGPLKMGVAGAALATIIGQAVSFLWALYFLYKNKASFSLDFKKESFKIDRPTLKVLVKLGVPFALQSSAISLSMVFVSGLVNTFGVFASATFGVGTKVSQIPGIMGQSIGMAVSSMVGQNMGAGKPERAKHTVHVGLMFTTCIYTLMGIVFFLFPSQIFSIFTNEQEVIDLSRMFVTSMLLGFPAMAFMSPINAFIQGIGFAAFSFVTALLDGIVIRITLSWFLGIFLNLGLFGFFLGYSLAAYGTTIPAAVYFFSGMWRKRKMLTQS